MVPEAVRTGRGNGARTGVVRMLTIFMGADFRLGEMGVIGEQVVSIALSTFTPLFAIVRYFAQSVSIQVSVSAILKLLSRPCKIRFSKSTLHGVTKNHFFDDHVSDPIAHSRSPHAPGRIV